MRQGLGQGQGGVAGRRSFERGVDGRHEPIDKGRQVIGVGPVHGLEARELDRGERIVESGCEFLHDPWKIGRHQSAAAGKRLYQHQRQTFVQRRQDAHGAFPGQPGELLLGDLPVPHHCRRHPIHPSAQVVSLDSGPSPCDVEDESRPPPTEPGKGVEEPRQSFDGAQLADEEQSGFQTGFPVSSVEQVLAISRAHHLNATFCNSEPAAEPFAVPAVEDQESFVARAAGNDSTDELGAQLHLPQPGRVTVGDDRGLGCEVLDQGRHQPHVVGVDEIGFEVVEDRPQVFGPGTTVGIDLCAGEPREPGARIRHDVTHAGNREVERRCSEHEGVDPVTAQTTNLRPGGVCR